MPGLVLERGDFQKPAQGLDFDNKENKMKPNEVQMLIQLREFARQEFDKIEGKGNPLAQMRAQDAAWTLSSVVNSLDDVLKPYVQIQQKEG